jgi:uncharacterized membrane protein YebE (DUF533 family)
MDTRALLDQLLQSGRDFAEQTRSAAEKKLDIPANGPDRETKLDGIGKGVALGGLLALLIGTQTGRKVTGSAVKVGGLAAIGGLAYKAFRDWQAQAGGAPSPQAGATIDQLAGPQAEQRSQVLLKAMIAAANADGHIDDRERAQIDQQLKALPIDSPTIDFVRDELAKAASPVEIAAHADTPEAAVEIYLVSLAVIDDQNERERAYLQQLAAELKLDPALVATLELQAGKANG